MRTPTPSFMKWNIFLLFTVIPLMFSCSPPDPAAEKAAGPDPDTAFQFDTGSCSATQLPGGKPQTATWTFDPFKSPKPDLSKCKLTLSRNTQYEFAIESLHLPLSAHGGNFGPTNEYVDIMNTYPANSLVFAEPTAGLFSSTMYDDQDPNPSASGHKAVGRLLKLTTGNNVATGTLTITVVRRPDKSKQGSNKGDPMPPLPASLTGLVDLNSLQISITIQ